MNEDGRKQRHQDVTNERSRRGNQTGKQREEGQVKCGRNVTDSWGMHVDPVPHAAGGFQMSRPSPPFALGC